MAVSEDVLDRVFRSAAAFFATKNDEFTNFQKVIFYGLYKQATAGPPESSGSGGFFSDPKKQAWEAYGHLSAPQAKEYYIRHLADMNKGFDVATAADDSTAAGVEAFSTQGPAKSVSRLVTDVKEPTSDAEVLVELVRRGDAQTTTQLLVEQPGLIRARDEATDGCGLHWAADSGHAELLELFLARGLPLEDVDDEDCTPLHLAMSCENYACVRRLLTAGARLDAADVDGTTPGQLADDNSTIRELCQLHALD